MRGEAILGYPVITKLAMPVMKEGNETAGRVESDQITDIVCADESSGGSECPFPEGTGSGSSNASICRRLFRKGRRLHGRFI